MGDWAPCGFRNVNDLLGISRHFDRGLKVPIPLYQCDEGEERLRWFVFGRRWRHAPQFDNGCYESEPLNTPPGRHARALCKKCIDAGLFVLVSASCGRSRKRYDVAKGFNVTSFAVSNISFGLSGLICLSRFTALEFLRLAHRLVMPSLNLWRFLSVSNLWIVVCFGFRDQGAGPWG